jgi:predicted cupin superfamily sugar epimerase
MKSADYWIHHLQLQVHPEGGFFKETYRANEVIPSKGLPGRFDGSRNFSTAIYFLLRSQDRSVFHRIKSDEIWHFYAGTSLTLYTLSQTGLTIYTLGAEPENQELLQVVVPAGCWFGAQVNSAESYTLAGCTVAPGFDFNDFEIAKRDELLQEFPQYKSIIERLTL